MMKRILLIANDLTICHTIQESLQDEYTDVSYAISASEVWNLLARYEYCLVILDVDLQDVDGLEMLRILREIKHFPIIALTVHRIPSNEIELLRIGANVCLEKPVDMAVCSAQTKSLMQLYLESDREIKYQHPIIFGTNFVIAPQYRQVLVDGQPLELTRKEFDLLHFLACNPRQVFNMEQLYNHIWGDDLIEGSDETVKVHIKKLRYLFSTPKNL